MRERIEYHMTQFLVGTTVAYLENKITPNHQRPEDGKQFFIMSPHLIDIVEQKLATIVDE